ncbi:MAG TPA: ABC transporter substrate-binding protein [Reyranella sp.]|jgi:polar amino acid transport system substrate-binding protein
MRRLSLVALLLCLSGAAAAQTLPPEILAAKKIKVGTTATYPPMESHDPKTGELVGFDIDLGNAIAKQLGVVLEWQDTSFAQLTPSAASGRVDMVMSAISDLPIRWEQLDLVDYIVSGSQFYALAKSDWIKSLDDLCGKKIGTVRSNSFPADITKWSAANCEGKGKSPMTVVGVDRMPLLVTEFQQGRIDAGVRSMNTMPPLMQEQPGLYKLVGEPITRVVQGIGFAKGNTQLRHAALVALQQLFADGTYTKLLQKWDLERSAVAAPTVNTKPVP